MKGSKYIVLTGAFFFITAMTAISQSTVVQVRKWGEFGNKPGEFEFPTMIAVDKNSNVFVVDQHNHRIQKFDSSGNFILMWGKLGNAPGEFNYPFGIAIDSKGDVYVSDMNNNRVQKFLSDGRFISSTGTYGKEDGQFKYPYGIAIDANDVLYVIDAFNYRVQKFSSELKYISKWGSAESIGIRLYMPHEIAITKEGDVIMTDRQNHRVAIFSADGKLMKRFGDFGEGTGTKGGLFSEPHGIAVSAAGEMYICDRYNFRVQKFDSESNYQLQWLVSGIFDDSKYFPLGIVVGKNDNIYVSDHHAHCIYQYKIFPTQ